MSAPSPSPTQQFARHAAPSFATRTCCIIRDLETVADVTQIIRLLAPRAT